MIEVSYARYPKEKKEAVVARLKLGKKTVTDINWETGIGIITLYR